MLTLKQRSRVRIFIYLREKYNVMHKPKTPNQINWSFIEQYYPNYYSSNEILLSDILSRKLEGQEIEPKDEEMILGWNVEEVLTSLNQKIYNKAMQNYLQISK